MDVSGDYTFDAPQDLTWKALRDPEVLTSVMPGAEDFKEVGENEYTGLLNIKVGPVQGKFSGTIKLFDIVEPESYKIQVDGSGPQGFVKATGGLNLAGQDAKTHMTYEGSAQIGGRIASVGQRLLDASTKSIIRQSLDGLNEYLKVQAAGSSAQPADDVAQETSEAEAAVEPAAYVPPSQGDVAKNVIKDVAGDIIPPRYRPLIIAIAVILVILILYLILK